MLALAPDASSQKAARGLANPTRWSGGGHADGDPPLLWGLCAGSGKNPYQACVDLVEPAYRCSCPSRKFPCKHALALLLLWSSGRLPSGDPPDWVEEWQTSRAARAARAAATQAKRAAGGPPSDPEGSRKRAAKREQRVGSGITELDRWLGDQIRQGLSSQQQAGYGQIDTVAARLVDAQAPAAASAVRRLAAITGSGPEAAARMLEELSLLRLLATAYRRIDELPSDLATTVRARIGFTVGNDEVLASERIRDRWQVLGLLDEPDERLTVRRVWLYGVATGRPALVLSFAAPGQALSVDLVPGTVLEADLAFHPGSLPLRAVVAERYGTAVPCRDITGAVGIADALSGYATALAAEPWLERWPLLLSQVAFSYHRDNWYVVDTAGDALRLRSADEELWRQVAVAGGEPVTAFGEWDGTALRLAGVRHGERMVTA